MPPLPSLQSNPALRIVSSASSQSYAVPAVCLYNLEGILASVRAAEAKQSPLILQLFPWALTYANTHLVTAASNAARSATVPIAVHLDHCQSPAMVRRAADMGGFDGIMIDMSHYEKGENLRLTGELSAYCHARGIVTEAEPGRINGGEDGVADTVDLEEVLTTPEQAEEFLAVGIDWLAPAFGNVHGSYGAKGPQLEYDRLRKLRESTKGRVDLVLHGAGAAWFDEKRFRECIDCGIAKCNINDSVNNPYLEVIQNSKGKGLTSIIEEATDAMQAAVEKHMDYMGSTGKASAVKKA